MDNTESLIKKLVETHGEEGVCPTAHSWREIFRLGKDGPFHLINLLKFRSEVGAPNGPISGAAAYAKYSAGVGPAFARVGRATNLFWPGWACIWVRARSAIGTP